MYDVVVIGGGAAGMPAASAAAARGLRVLLLERGEYTGKKLRITGKGRCNVTNDSAPREAREIIPTGGKFLQSAMHAFPPRDAMALFESLGVPLKTERGNRVFPQSDKASDIVDALRRHMDKTGVAQKRGRAERVLVSGGAVSGVAAGGETIPCRAAILCTGGMSYPATGSTGDGYAMAAALGHTIVPPKPSLVPLEAVGGDCAAMQGLSLRNVRLTVYDGGKKPVFEDFGELLFTHFGLSGPLTLSASAHMRDFGKKNYFALIDLKPALDEQTLDKRLLRDFQKFANRDFANSLGELVNRLMIPVIIERSGVPGAAKVHSVTREQRAALLAQLKRFRVDIEKTRPIAEAIITSGGVATRELVPATMESKLVKNLHFAGEIIDADAYTGGFNLQIAWATARAAGVHVLPQAE
ncbi:MAG: NAD(P)/FAD-dependent oxidoreductase [Oscillospiraceae bacterium]|jgi:predicted Rossmann fold flavoprotein|nr:NAD(P)/FAD-dependent oxidoreductase [Oscillospiraceae bacterium]